MRNKGYPLILSVVYHFPRATALRGYRILARPANRSLFRRVNQRALRQVHSLNPRHPEGGHFYVILMPGTLHFLLPCLALLPADLRVLLIVNGAPPWERDLVARRFPGLPMCILTRLPGTSLAHGDVITLLLGSNPADFGMLDHDCYVFDRRIFEDLVPGPGRCLTAVFGGVSNKTGLSYPETFFLYLHTAVLTDIMSRYHVDARGYRAAPAHVRAALASIGMISGVYYKDHATFFDTLHLMLALALTEGYDYRFLQWVDEHAIAHLGGTSWKTPETKELIDCYIDWRFLELSHDPTLLGKYGRRFRPFRSAAEVRSAIPLTPEAFARIAWIDALFDRLSAGDADRASATPRTVPVATPSFP